MPRNRRGARGSALSLVRGSDKTAGVSNAEPMVELIRVLTHELHVIEELDEVLLRQRRAINADDPQQIEGTAHAISRVLVTLGEMRSRRSSLIAELTGGRVVPLAELEHFMGSTLPAPLVAARDAVCRAAEGTAIELAVNQHLLRRPPG
jgi:hypothetical protein